MYDVLVIGGGQAGLAAGYYLRDKNLSFAILDRAERVGNSWRERYDSLVLFSPRRYCSLPGLDLSGDPEGYPSKDEIADYLESYAKKCSLPIEHNTLVTKLDKVGSDFVLITNRGEYRARNVIVATGAFQKAYTPEMAKDIPVGTLSLHTRQYRNPSQIMGPRVLIVGAGNSGAQIAVELADKFAVTFYARHGLKFLPRRILGRSFHWWLDLFQLTHIMSDSFLGRLFRKRPIVGTELKAALRDDKIKLVKVWPDLNNFDTVIWATGFRPDFPWINLPDLKNTPGLHFLGLENSPTRSSGLLVGISRDAKFVVEQISTNSPISN